MDGCLDSPVEALVFCYTNLGLLTTVRWVWTWVAVLTAAVSFWRIRAFGSQSRQKSHVTPSLESQRRDTVSTQSTMPQKPFRLTPSESACSLQTTAVWSVDYNAGRKSKFAVYVENEDVKENEEVPFIARWSDVNGNGVNDANGVYAWEGMRVGRNLDLGWYRYQDLTVLNGSIVKLWNGVGRRNSA